jgi:hypothetical protein
MIFFLLAVFISNKLFSNSVLLDISHLSVLLLFFIGLLRLSYKQIFMSKKITTNMIIGSLVLYFLLALIWSIIYLILLIVFPEGFNGLSAIPWKENFAKVIYFSFTTLGYGDISPKNPVTEFFVYSEAISGVFYIAIIVSSLVGARIDSMRR